MEIGRRRMPRDRDTIDALFCGPVGRARTTAEAFAASLGLPARVVHELAEIDHGRLSGLTHAEVQEAFPGFEEARAQDKYFCRFPGGESYADADVRAQRALQMIAESGARSPLLVSHEMIGRMLLKNLAGLGRTEALALNHPSDLLYKVPPGRGGFEVLTPGTGAQEHTHTTASGTMTAPGPQPTPHSD